MHNDSERLHKLLAQHGLGSRREIEKWMLAGRVLLNGQPAQPGDRFREGDRVSVDGQDITARLRDAGKAGVLLYHKPQGQPVQNNTENEAEETVLQRLPAVRGSRWLVVNTMQPGDSGLLVLTSDGKLADALRRRSEKIASAYVARVLVPTPDFDPQTLPRRVQFNDQPVSFDSIEPAGGEGTNRWFRVEAPHSHRRAAVRALFETNGLKVSRVVQVEFAGIELPRDLARGKHRALPDSEVERLYALADLAQPVPQVRRTRAPRIAADRQRKPARRGRPDKAPPTAPSRGPARSGPKRRSTGSRKTGR